jgi:DNA (cytosine-5)-methyltransferase 1
MRDEGGRRVQRAEVRFDDVAGCLRVPAGGSSRQTVLIVEGDDVRSRLLSPRETARLMGLHDSYALPTNANDAYRLTGDGVVAPVVRFIAGHILEPALAAIPAVGKPNGSGAGASEAGFSFPRGGRGRGQAKPGKGATL